LRDRSKRRLRLNENGFQSTRLLEAEK